MRLVSASDRSLTTPSRPVTEVELTGVLALREPLLDLMKLHRGAGLAANQVGDTRRFFVFGEEIFVNPVIVSKGAQMETAAEGCLSYPGFVAKRSRARVVTVQFVNRLGRVVFYTFKGLPARVIQHEMDHLDGITIVS